MSQKISNAHSEKQPLYIGIDVHKKQWHVSLYANNMYLKTWVQDPSPEQLSKTLQQQYPTFEYFSCYEAGFCGYWIHRELNKFGIKNIVVSPNAVPSRGTEKLSKSDTVDSRKLARELGNKSLSGIYVPGELQQEFRSLLRLRTQLVKASTRLKNQIKSHLMFYGQKFPDNSSSQHWSKKFIQILRGMSFTSEMGKAVLNTHIDELLNKGERIKQVMILIKESIKKNGWEEDFKHLLSVPGVGPITAATLLAEIMDINRFSNQDKLASYVGLAPAVISSGESSRVLGLVKHHNPYLRNLLIEAAWVAVRRDPVLTQYYGEQIKTMPKTRAIVKVARKLLNRIRTVWQDKINYAEGVIK